MVLTNHYCGAAALLFYSRTSESEPETRDLKGWSYALFPVSLRRYLPEDKLFGQDVLTGLFSGKRILVFVRW